MLDKSLFASAEVQEREVTLPDGGKHKLYFREASAVDFRKFVFAQRSEDEDRQAASISQLIAACVCEPDGKPALTVEQASRLKPAAANAIFSIIMEMAQPPEGNGSRLEAKIGSGTSSPSDSAAEQ
ncbi:hypothetical protein [Bordetella genomosp. 9]|uniref:Uncharacterized protein n=1 Tax=Bordetella genomosp. 9 TaxID=1416803 RepID=A0A1W6YYW7_9BORD|nr:hypothetical protein [Bordetella genomosp. 9]ARP86297.1 hypothetical protein CAL13_08870 [Bordetella genomosp. 9]